MLWFGDRTVNSHRLFREGAPSVRSLHPHSCPPHPPVLVSSTSHSEPLSLTVPVHSEVTLYDDTCCHTQALHCPQACCLTVPHHCSIAPFFPSSYSVPLDYRQCLQAASGDPVQSERHSDGLNMQRNTPMTAMVASGCPYLPLPMEGNAMDFSFLSSARAKQFFTVFSRSSSHLSAPQTGLLQWITNLAGRPCPALTAAGGDETGTVSLALERAHSTGHQT